MISGAFRKTFGAAAAVAALTAVVACAGGDSRSTGIPPSVSPRTLASGETPQYSRSIGALPQGFPSSFPTFQGASVDHGDKWPDAWVLEWRSDSRPADIAAYYKSSLDGGPWHVLRIVESAENITVIDFSGASETKVYTGQLSVSMLPNGLARILMQMRWH